MNLARLLGLGDDVDALRDLVELRPLVPVPESVGSTAWKALREAGAAAAPSLVGRAVLLLGARAATMLGVAFRPYLEWRTATVDGTSCSIYFASVPHTSPLNRTWNAQATRKVGEEFLRKMVADARSGDLQRAAIEHALSVGQIPRGEQLYTYAEAAAILRVSPVLMRQWVASRSIRFVRINKCQVRFRASDLRELVSESIVEPVFRTRSDAA